MIGGAHRGIVLTVTYVVLAGGVLGVVAPTAAAENEPPLADAGLDQDVVVNTTVVLDAGSSRDPDGSIESYEWRIETPDGNYTDPDCVDCVQTEYMVRETGTYNATVTVTDDDGAERSDTMRIHVESVDGPTVTVSGPTSVGTAEGLEYTATVEAGDHSLVRVDWYVDGGLAARHSVAGDNGTDTVGLDLTESGSKTVTAEVYDEMGYTDEADLEVEVTPPGSPPCAGATWNATSGSWDTDGCGERGSVGAGGSGGSSGEECSRFGRDDDYYCENDRSHDHGEGVIIHDADNDGEINWKGETYSRDDLEDMAEETDGLQFNRAANALTVEDRETHEEVFGTRDMSKAERQDTTQKQETKDAVSDSSGGEGNNDSDSDVLTSAINNVVNSAISTAGDVVNGAVDSITGGESDGDSSSGNDNSGGNSGGNTSSGGGYIV